MIETINKALNLITKLDPQANHLLLPLENKSLTIHLCDIDYTISINVKNQNLYATNSSSKNVLSGKVAYVIELVFNKNLQELLIAEKLDYKGSLKELNEFNYFFNALDIDIIYKISQLTNPSFANLVAKPFNKAKEYLQISRQETIIDIKDYLTEEKQLLISQNEINIFYREIQELKQSVDRIDLKLKLLQGLYND
ncbi:protein YigP [Francisella sp. W12-1067]|nr:protein YigP [Francisella sp. W12-1067]